MDCGDVAPLMEYLASLGGGSFEVKGVLLTQAHFDYIYGLPGLAELFPKVKVITNEAGRRTLADPRRNLSRYHGNPIAFESDNVVVCEEGMWWSCLTGCRQRFMRRRGIILRA